MTDHDPKVRHVIFGPPGYFDRGDDGNIVGLDEAETKEIIALAKESLPGNPHHNPRYRELYEKFDRALKASVFGRKKGEEPC
jgi:hypothetical protein